MATSQDDQSKASTALTAASLAAGSPELGPPTLITVGQLAEQTRNFNPDPAANIERIKNWTREGYLAPADKHHAGRGKHRRYDPSNDVDVAVLNVVADAGLPIATHRYLRDVLALVHSAHQRWSKDGRGIEMFLEIALTKTGDPIFEVYEGAFTLKQGTRISIVLSLSQIFFDLPPREITSTLDRTAKDCGQAT